MTGETHGNNIMCTSVHVERSLLNEICRNVCDVEKVVHFNPNPQTALEILYAISFSPRIRLASRMSLGMIVTRFA